MPTKFPSPFLSCRNICAGSTSKIRAGFVMPTGVYPRQKRVFSGQRFNRWTVIKTDSKRQRQHSLSECVCICGTVRNVRTDQLLSGHSKSCGCWKKESAKRRTTKHGLCNTLAYNSWTAMMERCYNENHVSYRAYGGRGISVDSRWHSVENFYADMGERPSKKFSLERLNINGDYCKSNCKWGTSEEQNNNRRNTLYISFKGKTAPLVLLAKAFNMPSELVRDRLRYGWSVEDALTKPKIIKK